MKDGSTAMTQRPRDRVLSGSMLALLDPRRPNRANPPKKFWWSLFFFWQHRHDLHALGCHWTDSQQVILCWGFKGVQEESTLQIGSVEFPVVMRQLRRWKRQWRRSLTHSHKSTSMGPSRSCWNGRTGAFQPDEITSKGTRVSCVDYQ